MSSHQPLRMLKQAHTIAFQNSIPWFVTLELGLQCNLTCSHCYNFDRSKPIPDNMKSNITTERILTLIDELKDAGTLMIAFSGGESLMHPDIFNFIKRTRELNLLPKIKTNGTLITPELAQKIKDHEVFDVDISVYGVNELQHDWLTNKKDSFNKTINGIKNLRNINVAVNANFIVHQKNYKSIGEMIKLADDLDCTYSISSEMTKRYDQSSPQDLVGITEEQFSYLVTNFPEIFQTHNEEENLQCECARTVCGINHKGDVYPCIGAPVFSGNIVNESFKNIWENSLTLKNIRNLEKKDFEKCSSCSLIKNCSRSSGGAFVNTGIYTGPNPQNCMEAKVRNNLN